MITQNQLNDIRAGFERLTNSSPWAIPHRNYLEREFNYQIELSADELLSVIALTDLKERNLIRFAGLKVSVYRNNSTMSADSKTVTITSAPEIDSIPDFVNTALKELRVLCNHKNHKGVGGGMCSRYYKCLDCGYEFEIDSSG